MPDNSTETLTIRASFNQSTRDNAQFRLTVSNVTVNTASSSFAAANAGGLASAVDGDKNKIEVTATKLVWQQQPSTTFVNVAMSPSPAIRALDANDQVDYDYAGNPGLSSDGTLSSSPTATFANGLGTYSDVIHSTAANNRRLNSTNSDGLTNTGNSDQFNVTAPPSESVVELFRFIC
ncbi:MAG: hypothetical protein HC842_07845 [Cytophagales bacterium]|nr:hypothetical protein [Cytophagales bacterium]